MSEWWSPISFNGVPNMLALPLVDTKVSVARQGYVVIAEICLTSSGQSY
jgi:hypothetical protein